MQFEFLGINFFEYFLVLKAQPFSNFLIKNRIDETSKSPTKVAKVDLVGFMATRLGNFEVRLKNEFILESHEILTQNELNFDSL